ncbi:MAG: helix-turn-helix domain-containing protein [Clostridia bacterium]|nr:helix-turn-helix domain-containing protein [Clostridia bacterium]
MENKSFLESPIPSEKRPVRVKPITPKTDNTPDYPLHRHEHLELLYVKEGECLVIHSGERIEAKQDDFVVVNFNEIHATEMSENCFLICVQIAPVFFSVVDFTCPSFRSYISDDPFVSDTMLRILAEHTASGSGSDMEIMGLTYRLICHLLRNYTEERSALISRGKREHRISEIISYVSSHYAEHITTAGLAERFFLSEYHFCRFFKETTGMTPTDYINKYRIACASALLKNTDLSVTEVALRVGFTDSNYFTKLFKRYRGSAPREFKKQ